MCLREVCWDCRLLAYSERAWSFLFLSLLDFYSLMRWMLIMSIARFFRREAVVVWCVAMLVIYDSGSPLLEVYAMKWPR